MKKLALALAIALAVGLVAAGAATAVAARPPGMPTSWAVAGKVASVDTGAQRILLKGKSTVIAYSEETTIYGIRERAFITIADIYGSPRRPAASDIVKAAGTVTEESPTTSRTVNATWINVLHPVFNVNGKIVALDTANKTLAIYKNKRWPRVVVTWTDSTRVVVGSRKKGTGVLEMGQRVHAHGYRKGTTNVATWFKILRPKRKAKAVGHAKGGKAANSNSNGKGRRR